MLHTVVGRCWTHNRIQNLPRPQWIWAVDVVPGLRWRGMGAKKKLHVQKSKEAFPEKSTSSSLAGELLSRAGRRGCD